MKKTFLLLGLLAFLTFNNQAQTVMDIDGNVYNTVTIGTQVWMKENLKVTQFNNNIPIPNITENIDWADLSTAAYCNYDNMPANADIYGRLYNWFAVNSTHKLCPTGWHVPSAGEWNILLKYLDPTVDTLVFGNVGTDIGGQLKEMGTAHWALPNTGATNSSGFTALPAGFRWGMPGIFGSKSFNTTWWSSTSSMPNAIAIGVFNDNSEISISNINSLNMGFSVRCIKDAQTSIKNNDEPLNNIGFYPNPSSDLIYFTGLNEHTNIQIFNALGKLVYGHEYTSSFNGLNISGFAKGVYLIRFNQKNTIKFQKLIIE